MNNHPEVNADSIDKLLVNFRVVDGTKNAEAPISKEELETSIKARIESARKEAVGASATPKLAKQPVNKQVDTSISGAYHDGYRDGYQTAKATFLELIRDTEHKVGACERLKALRRKTVEL